MRLWKCPSIWTIKHQQESRIFWPKRENLICQDDRVFKYSKSYAISRNRSRKYLLRRLLEFISSGVGLSVNLLNDYISRRASTLALPRFIRAPLDIFSADRIEQQLSRSLLRGRTRGRCAGWMDGMDRIYIPLGPRRIFLCTTTRPITAGGRVFLHPPFIRKYNPVIGSIHFRLTRMRSACALSAKRFFFCHPARRLESQRRNDVSKADFGRNRNSNRNWNQNQSNNISNPVEKMYHQGKSRKNRFIVGSIAIMCVVIPYEEQKRENWKVLCKLNDFSTSCNFSNYL